MADTIEDALLALHARDQDHASQLNGVGFNGRDTGFGNSLAEQVEAGRKLSPKQLVAAHRMLRTYKRQLAGYGVDYDAIPEPKPPAEAPQDFTAAQPHRGVSGTVELIGDVLEVRTTGYDRNIVAWCKSFPNRLYDPDSKVWSCIMDEIGAELLDNMPTNLVLMNPELVAARAEEREAAKQASAATDSTFEVPELLGELMPFQRAGIEYVVGKGRVLVADEMGLGKTVQAIGSIVATKAFPALVVVPAVVKLNWHREWAKWYPEADVAVLSGRGPVGADPGILLGGADVVVVNYDILASWLQVLRGIEWGAVVFDESHYLKNAKAQRTKAAHALAGDIPLRIGLTGTPILNRPNELPSQLKALGLLDAFGGHWAFLMRYCDAHREAGHWNLNGASHLEELHEKLRSIGYVRRTKQQVLKDLPAKRRVTLPFELADRARYDKAVTDLQDWVLGKIATDDRHEDFRAGLVGLPREEATARTWLYAEEQLARLASAEVLTRMEALKQIAAEEKLEGVKAWIGDFLETGKKLVVFGHHRHIVRAIAEPWGAPMITGDTAPADRQGNVDLFQNDPDVRLIVCNLQAAGVGITLTAASDVAFVELPWRPGDLDQAEDRCHRIGQHDSVTAWYLLAHDSIEEAVGLMIDEKRTVVDAATDGKINEEKAGLVKQLLATLHATREDVPA